MSTLERVRPRFLVGALITLVAAADVRAQEGEPLFAPLEPAQVGIDADKLEELAAIVQGYVDSGAIVGAELSIVKDDRTVLERGFGWLHREEGVRMQPGALFCVRSMTKAVVGTAVQMLVDEKELALGDRVSKYLPSFDNERSREITIEQLLTHTGGLPLSGLLGKDVSQLTSIREVADWAGERGPELPPGEGFHYSDDGADTLGALVEVASGMALADFLEQRIFVPLGMRETIAVVRQEDPLRERVASAYVGGAGSWTRFFGPTSEPIFSTLLASQGLYCSLHDYARFLCLWRENGLHEGERLLSTRAVRRALEPGRAMPYPTTFAGMQAHYGQMMQLWVDPAAEKKARVFAFGHGGSDGTHAWVFPEIDLMVFYFTQSRGNTTGIEIEKDIQRLVVDPLLGQQRAPPLSYTDAELLEFEGLYAWDDDEYCAIVRRHGRLAAELPGLAIVDLEPTKKRDSFDFKLATGIGVDFERAQSGAVDALLRRDEGELQRMPRMVPSADLPGADELMQLRRGAVDWTELAELGTLRWQARLALPALQLDGQVVSHARGMDHFKSEIDFGTRQGSATLVGEQGWSWSSAGKLEELDGDRLAALRFDHPLLPIADWRALYRELRVLARSSWADADAWLVRATPQVGVAHTWYVSVETGLPLALLTIAPIPGVGEVGIVTEYEDWRDVGPIRLPFHRHGEYATPLLGTFDVRVEAIEANAAVGDEVFSVERERASGK